MKQPESAGEEHNVTTKTKKTIRLVGFRLTDGFGDGFGFKYSNGVETGLGCGFEYGIIVSHGFGYVNAYGYGYENGEGIGWGTGTISIRRARRA